MDIMSCVWIWRLLPVEQRQSDETAPAISQRADATLDRATRACKRDGGGPSQEDAKEPTKYIECWTHVLGMHKYTYSFLFTTWHLRLGTSATKTSGENSRIFNKSQVTCIYHIACDAYMVTCVPHA